MGDRVFEQRVIYFVRPLMLSTSSSQSVFSSRETHGRAFRPGNRLIANSENVGWRSLHAAILQEAPFHMVERPIRHPSLIYHLCHPTEVSRKIEGHTREKTLIGPRRLTLTP